MEKTILIIEDNPTQLESLKLLTAEVNENAVIYTASKSSMAYKILMEKTVDVFMVDIILDTNRPGDTSGIKLVEKIREIPRYLFTPVIFITSLEDVNGYAYKDLNCLGYVEKPFAPEQVKKLLTKALNYSTEKKKDITICFRKDGIIFPVRVEEIVYIESLNHFLHIHLEDGELLKVPYMSCRQILEDTDSNELLQCSRNTIVNKRYIFNIDLTNRYISLKNDSTKLEIGITYKKKVNAEYRI